MGLGCLRIYQFIVKKVLLAPLYYQHPEEEEEEVICLLNIKSKSNYVEIQGNRKEKRSAEEELAAQADIEVGGGYVLKHVKTQRHLGVLVDGDMSFCKHLEISLAILVSKFDQLGASVWYNSRVPMDLKVEIYNSTFVPSLQYGSHGMSMESKEWSALNKFNNRCVRIIGGFHWKQRQERHTKDKEIFEKTGMATLRHLWDKELLRTMARCNRKGVKSWGNLALTSFIPREEAGIGGGSSAADPIVERFIATLERLAGVVEARGSESYKVYCHDREDGGDEVHRRGPEHQEKVVGAGERPTRGAHLLH